MRTNKLISILLFCTIFTISMQNILAEDMGDLTLSKIKEIQESFELNAANRAIMNAVTNNDLKKLTLNREIYNSHNDIFNFKIETEGITNQKSTGRCWLFAGLNILRPAVMKKYNLSSFEFSQNYLFFWDKLEKSNIFLEAIISTRKEDIDDRELQTLIGNPIPDGGWWSYVSSLIYKYGVVPKDIMPETINSESSRRMNYILKHLLRHDAAELRKLSEEGSNKEELRLTKLKMLEDVYKILVFHLGEPLYEFMWRFEDKDGKIVERKYTPAIFYSESVGIRLNEYITLLDHPLHDYNERYQIEYCRNMSEVANMDFINIKTDQLKKLALEAVLDSVPVWFAADVGHDMDREKGIMATGLYDYTSLFDIDITFSKEEAVAFKSGIPGHAMVFVGVDTLNGRPRKWLVENSWGSDGGNNGYWSMYDSWFDKYVFNVIIPKKYLPEDMLKLLDKKPEILPAWDPMRNAF